MDFKPFTTSLMGSMPRSTELIDAKKDGDKATFDKVLFHDTKNVVKLQEDAGIDAIVDGELSRDNYMSFVGTKVDGIKMMSLKEIAEKSTDKKSFEKSVANMDASDENIRNPIAVGKLNTDSVLDFEEIKRLKTLTDHPIKATLPSPYLLTRSMWLPNVTGEVYDTRADLGEDVVKLLLNEIHRLIDIGVDIIQIDDPILSDVVFNRRNTKGSFY